MSLKIVAFKYALLKYRIPVVVIIINVTEGTLQTQLASGKVFLLLLLLFCFVDVMILPYKPSWRQDK